MVANRIEDLVIKYLTHLKKTGNISHYDVGRLIHDEMDPWPEITPFLHGSENINYMLGTGIVSPQLEKQAITDWNRTGGELGDYIGFLLLKYIELRGKNRWTEIEPKLNPELLIEYMVTLGKPYKDLEQLLINKLAGEEGEITSIDGEDVAKYETVRGKEWSELIQYLPIWSITTYVKHLSIHRPDLVNTLLNKVVAYLEDRERVYDAIGLIESLIEHFAKTGIERDARLESFIKNLKHHPDSYANSQSSRLWKMYLKTVIPKVGIMKKGQTSQDFGTDETDYDIADAIF